MTIDEAIAEVNKRLGTEKPSVVNSDSLKSLTKTPKKRASFNELKESAKKIRSSVERYSREFDHYA